MSAVLVQSAPLASERSSAAVWAGRILLGIAALFLLFDTGIKLAGAREAIEGTVQLGYAPHQILQIGLIELVCLILYLVPRTAPLGAVLLTGYFGGAVATHFRLQNPLFSHTLFPIYVATLVWGALYLRDPRVRAAVGSVR